MSKHTPGPWRADQRCIEGPDGNIALLNLARGEGVTRANARLIAAAPDLLVMLQGFVAAMEGGLLVCDKPSAKDVLLDVARAAIAKAEDR
jgi:hypothetical protein